MNGSEFFLELDPPRVTSQMKGINYKTRHVFTKPEVTAAENLFAEHLEFFKPTMPSEEPIRLRVEFHFGYSGKSHKDGEWKTTKPDTDNLIKILKDVMTRVGFWKDDAQVVLETVGKKWSKTPGILISWKEMERWRDDA